MILTVTPGGTRLLFTKPRGRGVPWLRSELSSDNEASEFPGPTTMCKELTAVCRVCRSAPESCPETHT